MRSLKFTPTQTILLIEDHSCLCDVLAAILRRCGYRVIQATRIDDARQVARDLSDIDLLLGPIELPEMSRETLAEWFSPSQPRAKVMWTSTGSHGVGAADSVIEKPYIYIDAFIRKVRASLNPKPAVNATAIAA